MSERLRPQPWRGRTGRAFSVRHDDICAGGVNSMQAFIERFEGTAVQTDERDIASPRDAEAAIDMLDGRSVTSVTFENGEAPRLMVSGGPGAYLASIWDDEAGTSWVASDPGAVDRDREVEMVSAGQSVRVPAPQILSRARLGAVVAQFVEDGARSDAVIWRAE